MQYQQQTRVSINLGRPLRDYLFSRAVYRRCAQDMECLKHHAKIGKGFSNSWNSYREQSDPQILRALLWCFSLAYVPLLANCVRGI